MPVRVLNDSNLGRTSDIANGAGTAALNGANMINLDLGTPLEADFPPSDAEREALDLAAARDVVVVVAAMNDSQNNDTGHTPIWPCNFPHANLVCVAAIDFGGLSSFSNYGATSVDVAAPGRSILSLKPGSAPAHSARHRGVRVRHLHALVRQRDLVRHDGIRARPAAGR